MKIQKILIVDDNEAFVRLVVRILRQEGYKVIPAGDGQEALQLLFIHKPDLVLLDMEMPRLNGWQTCMRIRDISDIPVIILTGKHTDEADIVRGLGYGADDYLIKPVGNRELAARVRTALRRAALPSRTEIKETSQYADDYLTVIIEERRVTVNGERIRLTPVEFRLLACLVENAGHILSHRQLLEKVWGWEYINDIDYVRVYISHLRQKIEREPSSPRYMITEPGVGYSFQKAGLL